MDSVLTVGTIGSGAAPVAAGAAFALAASLELVPVLLATRRSLPLVLWLFEPWPFFSFAWLAVSALLSSCAALLVLFGGAMAEWVKARVVRRAALGCSVGADDSANERRNGDRRERRNVSLKSHFRVVESGRPASSIAAKKVVVSGRLSQNLGV